MVDIDPYLADSIRRAPNLMAEYWRARCRAATDTPAPQLSPDSPDSEWLRDVLLLTKWSRDA